MPNEIWRKVERTPVRIGTSGREDAAMMDRLKMAGATGLEPAASGVTGRRSNQLSYAPARD